MMRSFIELEQKPQILTYSSADGELSQNLTLALQNNQNEAAITIYRQMQQQFPRESLVKPLAQLCDSLASGDIDFVNQSFEAIAFTLNFQHYVDCLPAYFKFMLRHNQMKTPVFHAFFAWWDECSYQAKGDLSESCFVKACAIFLVSRLVLKSGYSENNFKEDCRFITSFVTVKKNRAKFSRILAAALLKNFLSVAQYRIYSDTFCNLLVWLVGTMTAEEIQEYLLPQACAEEQTDFLLSTICFKVTQPNIFGKKSVFDSCLPPAVIYGQTLSFRIPDFEDRLRVAKAAGKPAVWRLIDGVVSRLYNYECELVISSEIYAVELPSDQAKFQKIITRLDQIGFTANALLACIKLWCEVDYKQAKSYFTRLIPRSDASWQQKKTACHYMVYAIIKTLPFPSSERPLTDILSEAKRNHIFLVNDFYLFMDAAHKHCKADLVRILFNELLKLIQLPDVKLLLKLNRKYPIKASNHTVYPAWIRQSILNYFKYGDDAAAQANVLLHFGLLDVEQCFELVKTLLEAKKIVEAQIFYARLLLPDNTSFDKRRFDELFTEYNYLTNVSRLATPIDHEMKTPVIASPAATAVEPRQRSSLSFTNDDAQASKSLPNAEVQQIEELAPNKQQDTVDSPMITRQPAVAVELAHELTPQSTPGNATDIDRLLKAYQTLLTEVSQLREEVSQLKRDVANSDSQCNELKSQLKELKKNVTSKDVIRPKVSPPVINKTTESDNTTGDAQPSIVGRPGSVFARSTPSGVTNDAAQSNSGLYRTLGFNE